jgi:threonine dehydratase
VQSPSVDGIHEAAARLAGRIRRTPLVHSPRLSALCGCELWLKHEYQQVTGSFKERGACNKLLLLGAEERRRGVVAASAGNHALGLAYHARRLGVPLRVIMPRFAPMVKVAQCRSYGAEVELAGNGFDEARARAKALADAESLTFVHGFDDPRVIEGQGTLGLELIEQASELGTSFDTLLVPVGGGGLAAGVCLALERHAPSIEVIGVEAEHAPTLTRALAAGQPVPVPVEASLADGLAVSQLGALCFDVLARALARVVLVSEQRIASAIVGLMEVEKAVVEGAGAVGLAWALGDAAELRGRRVVVVLSGGNIDLNIVSRIIERGLAAAGRLCKAVIELNDRPGSLATLLALLASLDVNILEVVHDRNFGPSDVAKVSVSVVLETRDASHVERVREALQHAGIGFELSLRSVR